MAAKMARIAKMAQIAKNDTFLGISPLIIALWSSFWYQNVRLSALYKRVWGFETTRSRFLVENFKNV